jgi:sugar phosphate permease
MQRWLGSRVYYGWAMVASALVINTVVSPLNPVIFSLFLEPMTSALHVGKSAFSFSLTLRLLTAGLSGPVIGVLIDRYGARWLGALAGAIAGASLLALSFVHDLWMVYAIYAVSGLAGFGAPAGQLLTQVPLAKWFIRQRSRAMAIAAAGGAVGTVVAVPIVQALIDARGWRATWAILGVIVAAVVVPVSLLFVRRTPEDLGLLPDGAAGPDEPSPAGTLETEEEWTVRQALRTPALWQILAALELTSLGITGVLVHRVHFWQDTGISPDVVAIGTALDPFTVIFAMMVWGVIGDRVATRYVGFAGLSGLALAMLPMILT